MSATVSVPGRDQNERDGDRRRWVVQAVRQSRSPRRTRPVRGYQHRPRVARSQRRGQDHDSTGARNSTAPHSGRAWVAGYDVVREAEQVRNRIAVTGQYAAVDEILSGRQNLVLFGRLLKLSVRAARRRADELLQQFELEAAADTSVGKYSGGMRRRL